MFKRVTAGAAALMLIAVASAYAQQPPVGPDFGRRQSRMHVRNTSQARRLAADCPVAWFVFDVLYLDGHLLIDLPYSERRERLEALELPFPVPPSFSGDASSVRSSRPIKRMIFSYVPSC